MNQSKTNKTKPATITDVARLAGTSVTTVSRVLSDSGYPVNAETAARVHAAARELNYTPNLAGHLLKARSSKTLALIIPSFQNPFFIQLISGIEDAAASRGYTGFIFDSQRSVERERELIRRVALLNIHGLFLSSLDSDNSSITDFLASGGRAAVFETDCDLANTSGLIDAAPNMCENGSMATQALLDRGHRKIALLTTALLKRNRRDVCLGYRQAMEQSGIPEEQQLVIEAAPERERDDVLFEFEAGRELASRFMEEAKGYTGIVAVNDQVACGIVHRLLECHVRIPEDVSVIGIDNIPQGIMMSPPISTVDQDTYRHGYNTCLRLIEMLEHPERVHGRTRFYIPPRLILRESVRAYKTPDS